MTIFDMNDMSLDEFCDRLKRHPDQNRTVDEQLIREIFPECRPVHEKPIETTDTETETGES